MLGLMTFSLYCAQCVCKIHSLIHLLSARTTVFWFVCFLGLSSSRKYLSAYFHSAGRKHFLPFLSHFSSLVWLSQSLLFTFTHGNGKFSRSFLSKPVSSLLMSLWFLIMILDTQSTQTSKPPCHCSRFYQRHSFHCSTTCLHQSLLY